MSKKKEVSVVRSSAAEYLIFVAAGGNSEASVEMRYEDENIWLTQKMMATLYDVSVSFKTLGSGNFAGCRQGERRNCQSSC